MVIITGANRGIGKAIAVAFAEKGHELVLCARNIGLLEQVKAEIGQNTGNKKIHVFSVDLCDKDAVKQFASDCLRIGHPDILVNNAGVYLPGNCIDEPEGAMEYMMNINFFSAYQLSRNLIPAMKSKGAGHIFNICSVASLKPYDGGGCYSVSKFALNGLNQNLRHELRPYGIKVTGVFPGAVMTDSWSGFDNSNGRIMEAADIASMIYASSILSPQAVVEDIIIRPQLGDL